MDRLINIEPSDLMKIQAQTLYTMNTQQRLTGINEPEGGHAPALFIGMTSRGHLAYYNEHLPPNLMDQLATEAKFPLDIPKVLGTIEAYKPVKHLWMGPAFVFREKWDKWHSRVQLIDRHHTFLLEEHFPDLIGRLHAKAPVVAYVIGDSAVAVCCSARTSELGAEASLHTVPAYRGHGYGWRRSNAGSSTCMRVDAFLSTVHPGTIFPHSRWPANWDCTNTAWISALRLRHRG